MIKLIIFDLDGVLLDAKEIHYETLNRALAKVDSKYIISRDEHLKFYDGLPTLTKLAKLYDERGLSYKYHNEIYVDKQSFTSDVIKDVITEDLILREVLRKLKNDGYIIYVASNSIRETVKLALYKTGLIEFVDYYMSNNDVTQPKPHPEIYLRCMVHAGVKPNETLIIEDSLPGREAVTTSGATLCPVNSPTDVTYELINDYIKNKKTQLNQIKWDGSGINVLIPMAGAGSRFSIAGYTFPKPLIEVGSKPMIQVVVENLCINANFTYIVQKLHYDKYNLKFLLNLITPNCNIVQVDGITDGAACTTLLAREFIDSDMPLLIANSDQYIEWDAAKFYYSMVADKIDGGLLTFKSTHPKWSFVKLDEDNYVTEVAEKKPISDIATVGIYYWSNGSEYVKYADQMIAKNVRINNEFYVAPVYNEAILDNKKFKIFNINKMWGLGTPEDLNSFLENHK